MTTAYIQDGDVINVTATAGCTAGNIWAGADIAGVFLATHAAASTNTAVPVALSGVFTVPRKAATAAWAAGDYVYSLTTGGVNKAVNIATGAKPLGIATAATTSGATTGTVRLHAF